jgi:putative ABC transport system permease protein
MRRWVNLWFAVLGLRTNKLRSGLTTLGVVIGIGAVIMIVSLGNGLRRSTQIEMEAWSAGTVEIRAQMWGPVMAVEYTDVTAAQKSLEAQGETSNPSVPMLVAQQARGLEAADVLALRQLATRVRGVVPSLETWGDVIYKGQYVPNPGITGVTPEYLTVYRNAVKYGRFFNAQDEETAAPVVVLDESLVNEVWGRGTNPVGELLRVSREGVTQSFVIVGVLVQRPGIVGIGPRSLLMPLRTVQLRLSTGAKNEISMIAARVDSRVPSERKRAVAEMNTILRARRGIASGAPEDFSVQDTLQWSEEQLRIIRTITAVLSAIAGISLVVGSIGLMNIMLVGVAERTWEIGLRRALGAEKIDVLGQFLSEGILIALTGGAGGLALGLGGSYLGSRLVSQLKDLATVTPDVFVIAVGVSLLVGIVASIYPAWQAASLQPTAALRRG